VDTKLMPAAAAIAEQAEPQAQRFNEEVIIPRGQQLAEQVRHCASIHAEGRHSLFSFNLSAVPAGDATGQSSVTTQHIPLLQTAGLCAHSVCPFWYPLCTLHLGGLSNLGVIEQPSV